MSYSYRGYALNAVSDAPPWGQREFDFHKSLIDTVLDGSIAFSRLSACPTTLAGYGITDAVASNDSRLSDARSASDVYSWAKASSKPTYTYSEVGAAPQAHGVTTGRVPYASSSTAWGTSSLRYSSGNIGIGMTPTVAFEVSGNAKINGTELGLIYGASYPALTFNVTTQLSSGNVIGGIIARSKESGGALWDSATLFAMQEGDIGSSIVPSKWVFQTTSAAGILSYLTMNSVGDLSTVNYQDYAGSSTIVGWSSFATCHICYKKVGKLIFVWFDIEGTSNSVSVSFTLPEASDGSFYQIVHVPCITADNGGSFLTGSLFLQNGGSTVVIEKTVARDPFTASGSKTARGSFVYQSA